MPNIITSSGLQTATSSELIAQFTADFQAIYGADINLDPDTPDGQMMMIFIQSVLDLESLLTQIYNGFDPDLAVGNVLDQRVAINGIQRLGGTYTITPVSITTTLSPSQSITLKGLDLHPDDPYTVSDSAGTQYFLQITTTISTVGTSTTSLSFRAAEPGATLTQQNTINTPVTIVIGVTGVINPLPYTSLGLNQETDAQLKVRRQRSVALASKGYLSGLLAALQNISGVETAIVYENTGDVVDAKGITPHAIWVIVGGTVADVDVATAIYNKRNAGCGLYTILGPSLKTYNITQDDGSIFTVKWNTVISQPIFLKVGLTSIDGITPPLSAAIVAGLPSKFVLGVGETVDINEVATWIQEIDPNCLVTFPATYGLSANNVTFFNILSPSSFNGQMNLPSGNISFTIF